MSFEFFKNRIRGNKYLPFISLTFIILVFSVTKIVAQQGIVTFDYEYKSNAQGKMRAEQNRGRKARMFWNNSIKRWTVEVDYGSTNNDLNINDSSSDEEESSDSQSSTRTIVYHYDYKSNAQGKVKVERARGKNARMFYDSSRRKWAVEVGENVGAGKDDDDSPTVIAPAKRKVNTSAKVGSGNLPNGATVSYFPDKQMAEEIYRAAVKQGDWSKMWYDENRRAWAVAIKIR